MSTTSKQSAQPQPRQAGRWTAGAVARRLNVPPSTLRTWNHRYGVGPLQERGTHRLYSDQDVAELETIVRLVAAGTPPRAAVELVRAGGATGTPAWTASSTVAPVARTPAAFAGAAWELNSEALTAALVDALRERGVVHTWQRLCRPALARLARRDTPDEAAACIGAEIVLANAMTAALHHALSTAPPPAGSAPRVVLACAAEELHGLSLLALQVALAEAAVPTLMLGTSVADDVLLEAAARAGADAIAVYAHRRETARTTLLRQLAEVVPFVLAAGPGWTGRRLPEGVGIADDLPTARRLLGARRRGASVLDAPA
ncbi:MAG: MerR family transcriptional regulator [Sporichthyaceae bacterium]